ncbi:tRNA glutamyl-Q(34) synthetase GluQRS [Sphingopyxis sp. SE2]|jgi:glutamyl-Q tRNA(Asp) synthetase|uniref:tRNA glutamyl-Q(34) synthetase GluQRS n=1 Tax=unclassified Sphingopyxis TaxID=2614943 RepID=UPI00050E91EC|nr:MULTISPECIES: tRNA glutamyl-Q(34) synthetase GluQRS [unclassified Sphingopyxis]KGB59122.1 Glutamyl-tRNA synthetase, class Ic [Sphingopyxis sp. LC363]MDT7530480.1 tRNA glutamyl-Q(34) synthetase GluQRS [Sphingopyxis sp. SE2]
MLTRFAPSPTGDLHLGHAYSAVLAHAAARAVGGQFRLRIDDIDGGRSREDYVTGSLADLAWLGIDRDGDPVRQSDRLGSYAAALDDLRARGLVYPCFCTRADIAASLSAPHGPPDGPSGAIYPGTCRDLSVGERELRMADEPHCWRLDMARAAAEAGDLVWEEAGQGLRLADPAAHGDIVLARKDAPASYHLASTLDDAAMGVTHVIRGADLIASTDVHRLLQALLGLAVPVYRHHALVCGADGRRLAKRDAAASLKSLRDAGADGRTLAADLAVDRLPTGYSLQNP